MLPWCFAGEGSYHKANGHPQPHPARAWPGNVGTAARLAGQALPPELMHLVEGPFRAALGKAIDYAQTSVDAASQAAT